MLRFKNKYLKEFEWTIRKHVKKHILGIPEGNHGLRMRQWYYEKLQNVKFGGPARFLNHGFNIKFSEKNKVEIGKNFMANEDVIIDVNRSLGIIIGDNVGIGPRTFIRAGNHRHASIEKPILQQGYVASRLRNRDGKEASVIIEDNVWIGANCTILSGTYLKKGTVVAAGSVVSIKSEENSIVAGNPARVIGFRGFFKEKRGAAYVYYDY